MKRFERIKEVVAPFWPFALVFVVTGLLLASFILSRPQEATREVFLLAAAAIFLYGSIGAAHMALLRNRLLSWHVEWRKQDSSDYRHMVYIYEDLCAAYLRSFVELRKHNPQAVIKESAVVPGLRFLVRSVRSAAEKQLEFQQSRLRLNPIPMTDDEEKAEHERLRREFQEVFRPFWALRDSLAEAGAPVVEVVKSWQHADSLSTEYPRELTDRS